MITDKVQDEVKKSVVQTENRSVGEVKLYPNPTTNNIFLSIPELDGEKATIQIVSQIGQLVYFGETDTSLYQIDLKNISSEGVYVMLIQYGENLMIRKFMIHR